MEVVIKATAAALITAIAALTVKKYNPEIAFTIGVAGAIIIAAASFGMLRAVREFIAEIVNSVNISSAILVPPIKCTAIAITVKAVSSLSKDAGQAGVAAAVEYLGAAAAVYTVLPLIKSILSTIGNLT